MTPDSRYQFVLFAAKPYETIGMLQCYSAFKVPNLEIETGKKKLYSHWDDNRKIYILQIHFKNTRTVKPLPALPQKPGTFLPIGARW